jgi:hypothetical protein
MRYCAHPSCPVLVPKGRCKEHARQADAGTRGTAQQRGYTSQWATYSKVFRTTHPVCGERADGSLDILHSRCLQEGRTTPSACVDHIIPLTQGGSMWDEGNHLALCVACNTWKAQTLERVTC